MRVGMPHYRRSVLQDVPVCLGLIENRDLLLAKQTVCKVKIGDQTGPFDTDFRHRIEVCFPEILEIPVLLELYPLE